MQPKFKRKKFCVWCFRLASSMDWVFIFVLLMFACGLLQITGVVWQHKPTKYLSDMVYIVRFLVKQCGPEFSQNQSSSWVKKNARLLRYLWTKWGYLMNTDEMLKDTWERKWGIYCSRKWCNDRIMCKCRQIRREE